MSWLYLISRRIPVALGLLAAVGVLLWAGLDQRWNIAGGAAAQQIIAVTTYGPSGEAERAAGRWLPWLRLAATLGLTAFAVGVLAAGATGGHLPGGTVAMLRNLAGLTGTGLLAAAALGGAFGWTGPLAYLLITEGALAGTWTTPWMWAARPPHDRGAAICAAAVFAAALAVIAVRGGRDRAAR